MANTMSLTTSKFALFCLMVSVSLMLFGVAFGEEKPKNLQFNFQPDESMKNEMASEAITKNELNRFSEHRSITLDAIVEKGDFKGYGRKFENGTELKFQYRKDLTLKDIKLLLADKATLKEVSDKLGVDYGTQLSGNYIHKEWRLLITDENKVYRAVVISLYFTPTGEKKIEDIRNSQLSLKYLLVGETVENSSRE